ncbi:hypothetical protein D1610_15905 [Sphingomonas gilva]|uniref:Uncharacterized protein n=1 Tax=Sphingomonas gilva TaxID=2305907 RepID=A0A396RYZ8_9SPHN|nr:hypothetical protein [Sphingomonas gilva]RHW16325.1 hypothetical protein D1610_15905 [Sphingomonas gilva]
MVAAAMLGGTHAVAQDGFAAQYRVGQKVHFSVSGNAADFQTCTVSENPSGGLMRVRCAQFRKWAAGNYIVYGPAHIRPLGAPAGTAPRPASRPATMAKPKPKPKPPVPAVGGGLKPGEYACYGSGGRIMIGLGFKVAANGRYTDLEGGNPGTVSVAGGNVTFRGGHMDGQVGRDLSNHAFRIGLQARCEPY